MTGTSETALWIGTTAGLLRINKGQERWFTRKDGLADDSVQCLTQAADGSLWVGTRDGMSRVQGDKIESFRAKDGLSQSTVYSICEDREGSLWVGTKHGLNQFVDRRTIPITTSEGLPGNNTGPILQDFSETIWVGTQGAGLAQFSGQQVQRTLTVRDGLPSDSIQTLATGDPGDLWIGTEHGLCRLRDGKADSKYTVADGLPSDNITCLCRDQRKVLWIGTARGLTALDASQLKKPQGASELLKQAIVAIIDCGERGIVVATENGLFRSPGGIAGTFAPDEAGGDLRDVDAFCQDHSGLLWFGTRGHGVGLLDGKTVRLFTIKQGLYDNDVFGIVEDDKQRLWMACSRGIFSVPRQDLLAVAEGRLSRVVSTPFSPTDAQRTIECQDGVQPAVSRMKDGRMWFATIRGVTIIDPHHLQRSLPPIPVVVEEVEVNGQQVDPRELGSLSPGRTNLHFRFTALSFIVPSRLIFQHQLEGYDKDWIADESRRDVFYTNLPPGSYRFRVRAMFPDGDWYESEKPIALTLTPYFYQTRWFLVACLFAAAFGVWLAMRLRTLRIRAHWNTVLAERSRIARELHDTLIQGFSGVTMQMQALASRLPENRERDTLDEIIRDAGLSLTEARRSVGGLRDSGARGTGLVAALSQAARQLTDATSLAPRLKLEPPAATLAADVEYNVVRIAQEAITNAVKHSRGETLDVTLENQNDRLLLSIRDDGAGFRVPESRDVPPGHYGLIGMRERAAQIGATLSIDSSPGHGANVTLALPLHNGNARSRASGPETEAVREAAP